MTGADRRRVALLPFVASAVLVPLVIALPIGVGMVFTVPVPRPVAFLYVVSYFALTLGAVPYLVLGLPAVFLHLRDHEPAVWALAMKGFVANLATPFLMTLVMWLFGELDEARFVIRGMIIYWVFGSVFAVICGTLFAIFYRLLTRRSRPFTP